MEGISVHVSQISEKDDERDLGEIHVGILLRRVGSLE